MIGRSANSRVAALAGAVLGCVVAGCGGDAAAPRLEATRVVGPVDAPAAARPERVATATIARGSAFDAPPVRVDRAGAVAPHTDAPHTDAPHADASHADEPLPPPPIEAPAPPRASAASAATRQYRIQLGAYTRGSNAASVAWEGIVARHAALAGRTPVIGAALLADGTPVHRLQVAGLTAGEARDLCAVLAATGEGCFVVTPPHARPR